MKLPLPIPGRWIYFSSFITILLAFLFYPLTTDRYQVPFNETKISRKKTFLQEVDRDNPRPASQRPPNIVILMADDLGKTDISLYGSPHLHTPHIDRLGQQGVVFTEGYSSAPICSPSRAGLITGRYQQRFGYEVQPQDRYPRNRLEYYAFKHFIDTGYWVLSDNFYFPRQQDIDRQGLPPGELTLGELFQANGYRTALLGKWHLGHEEPFLPTRRGFDYMYGFYEAFTLYADTTAPWIVNHQHSDFSNDYIWGKGREGTCAIRRNEEVIEEKGYLTTRLAEEAAAFIRENQESPFMLYVPFSAPHTPFQAPQAYVERFKHVADPNKRVYYAMIQALDDAVGTIVNTIDSLGLGDNTLIFFASDNGGATYTHATDNAPLKAGKMSLFEGGINVPFLARWTGTIPASTTFRDPVSLLDIFTTSALAAGCPLPTDREYDGLDLMPFLTGAKEGPPHNALYWRSVFNRAIRQGPWKLIRDNRANLTMLYNLETDKEEKINRAEEHPETVRRLERMIREWEEGLQEPLWPNLMNFKVEVDGETYFFAA